MSERLELVGLFDAIAPSKRPTPRAEGGSGLKWIGLATSELHDDLYMNLTPHRRLLLLECRRVAADLGQTWLALDLKMIRRWTGLEVKMADVDALNHAGFTRVIAAQSQQIAALELEGKQEVELEVDTDSDQAPSTRQRALESSTHDFTEPSAGNAHGANAHDYDPTAADAASGIESAIVSF